MANYFGFQPADKNDYYFISYNTEDTDKVAEICRNLHQSAPLWYDYGIPYDHEWETVINGKIRRCRKIILFYTNGILKKQNSFVVREYKAARFLEKEMLIVMLEDVDKKKVPDNQLSFVMDLMERQSVQAVGKSAEEVSKAIQKALGVSAVHTQPAKPVRKDIKKILPDDPCPCGSGKKYKHCHGKRDYLKTFLNDADPAGKTLHFGAYAADRTKRKSPIEWVIAAKQGTMVLLVSKYILNVLPYSQAAHWLNNTFLDQAFTEWEKKRIIPVRNLSDHRKDYAFLLSSSDVSKYLKGDAAKMRMLKDIKVKTSNLGNNGYFYWFLKGGASVNPNGYVLNSWISSVPAEAGIVPAMWIELSDQQ